MLNRVITSYKISKQKMDLYFKYSKKEIADNNVHSITSISLFLLFITVLLIVLTPIALPDWHVTIGHWLMFPLLIGFLIWGHYLSSGKDVSFSVVHTSVIIYLVLLMALVIFIFTVPYPDSSATMVPVAMIVLPILFILPFGETTLLLLLISLSFMLVTLNYSGRHTIGENVFDGFVGFLFGLFVSWMTSKMRANENHDKQSIIEEGAHDNLTGLLIKSAAEGTSINYLENHPSHDCALIVCDLDDFKSINDTYGHHIGDKVLSLVGEAMLSTFRDSDILGRFGGDEFVILMKNISDKSVIQKKINFFIEKMKNDVLEKLDITITCSYGAIQKGSDTDTVSYLSLFNMADNLLYRAKKSSKNCGDIFTIDEYLNLGHKKQTMLIVEDMETNREMLKNLFISEFEIIEAHNGIEAMEIIRKHEKMISIILLDVFMPEMDGIEVLNHMNQEDSLRNIPVLVITSDEKSELELLKLGASDMITKPFDGEVVKMRVHNVLRNFKKTTNK